jgi:hypothetical protein
MRSEAECGACSGKFDLAKRAGELGYDAKHDAVMRWPRTRRGTQGLRGVAEKYFSK